MVGSAAAAVAASSLGRPRLLQLQVGYRPIATGSGGGGGWGDAKTRCAMAAAASVGAIGGCDTPQASLLAATTPCAAAVAVLFAIAPAHHHARPKAGRPNIARCEADCASTRRARLRRCGWRAAVALRARPACVATGAIGCPQVAGFEVEVGECPVLLR